MARVLGPDAEPSALPRLRPADAPDRVDRYRVGIFAAGGVFITLGCWLHFGLGWPFFGVLGGLLVLWVPVEWYGSRLMIRDGAAEPQ